MNVSPTHLPIHTDSSRLDGMKERSPDQAKLGRALRDFETLLLGQMLRSMNASFSFGEEGEGSSSAGLMSQMVNDQLAAALGNSGGIGISEMLGASFGIVEEFSPSRPVTMSRQLPERLAPRRGSNGGSDIPSIVERAAARYDLPEELLHAVIDQESSGKVGAVSHVGAKGLMQLMDGTARDMGVTDPFDPEQNVFGGARYLRTMLDRMDGDFRLALAGYNAGPGAVERYGGIPPYRETKNYVASIMNKLERAGLEVD